MESHHGSLIYHDIAFKFSNTYLAPSSQCKLNTDHGLPDELSAYLDEVTIGLTNKEFRGHVGNR